MLASPSPHAFLAAAADLLGPRGLTADPDLLAPWLTDWRGRFTGRALALAAPASTAEVAALVRLCGEHGVPIVPQGGNSGMSGGATPDATGGSLLLSLRRMDKVRKFDAEARRITCDAGMILENLHHAAEAEGLRFPLTLGGKGSATVGGLISTNAGGTQVLRHGSMRTQVLGIEAVLADGSVYDASHRHLVSSTRFVFNYAMAAREFGNAEYLDAARHGLRYLREVHRDASSGGYAWTIRNGVA